MAWIELHQGLREHRKLFACADELKVSRIQMIGILTSLWLWALDNAQNGSLEGISNRTIARVCDWPEKKADALIDALVRTRWLDKHGECVHIHDWADYAGKLMESRERDRNRKRKAAENKKNSGGIPAEGMRNSAATVPNTTVPNTTVPNTTVDTGGTNTGDGIGADGAGAPPFDGRLFTEFWNKYPAGKGGDREEAWKAWRELAPTAEVANSILAGLQDWIDSDQWAEDGGRYIPGAAKFLIQKRWLSPPSMAAPAQDGEDGPYSDALAHYRKLLDDREKGVGLFAK
ncbi:MAG: hypothetical protein IKT52_08670 [Oscillospiraceae bacterium]|nr:hypothetical protein [Oscillospiraceae bacterium]